MDHCKPPCWDRFSHGGDYGWKENGQEQWQPIDPPRSSCGSCWAFGQNEAGGMQNDTAAAYGQTAAYDYVREDDRELRQDAQEDDWQEDSINAQQNMPEQQGYAAYWADPKNDAWQYNQSGSRNR